MRFKKARGKVKGSVSLTENEIVLACYEYVRRQGTEPGDTSYLKIPNDRNKKDSLGRKRRSGIEFMVEIQ